MQRNMALAIYIPLANNFHVFSTFIQPLQPLFQLFFPKHYPYAKHHTHFMIMIDLHAASALCFFF